VITYRKVKVAGAGEPESGYDRIPRLGFQIGLTTGAAGRVLNDVLGCSRETMTEKYLTLEFNFLVPIVLTVAVIIYHREREDELRFLWTAVAVSLATVGANTLALTLGANVVFPATVCFLLLFAGYLAFRFVRR
jgi:hypothetical protein